VPALLSLPLLLLLLVAAADADATAEAVLDAMAVAEGNEDMARAMNPYQPPRALQLRLYVEIDRGGFGR
jgi:hypothetical protein